MIPNYELYGDLLAGRTPDAIHLEPIRERSSKHDWTIRLHRHRHIGQVFLFRSPGVFLRVGEVEHRTTQPAFLVIPPNVEHGFQFAEDVRGEVLSIRLNAMPERVQTLFAGFEAATGAIFLRSETAIFEDAAALISQLDRVHHAVTAQRLTLMMTLSELVLLYLQSARNAGAAPKPVLSSDARGRQERQAEAFCTMLEETFRDQLSVPSYAARLGLSASHLTRVCRTVLGAPPNALVRQRRILEAKRLLEYTELSVAEIAHRSGFREVAFFSRSFRTTVGLSPSAFRKGRDAG